MELITGAQAREMDRAAMAEGTSSLTLMERAAAGRDVDISPVSLQKAFVYLTGEEAHHETA